MLLGKRVIVGIPMTNVVKHKYWPISQYAVESAANTDFVDEVVIVDGQSEDDTIENHQTISHKVKILNGPKWDTKDLSSENFIRQRNFLYKYCQDLEEDCILIFQCSDVFYTQEHRAECAHVIRQMISEKYDYCIPPFLKVLTPWLGILYGVDKMTNDAWYELCITQFFKSEKIWSEDWVVTDNFRKSSRSLRKLKREWQTFSLVYEAWLFDRDQFSKKIQYHDNWDKNLTIEQSIEKMYYWKIKQFPHRKLDVKNHPVEFRPILELLQSDHLGFSLFNHLDTPMSHSEFSLLVRNLY